MAKIKTARFVSEIVVIDPDSKAPVHVAIYKEVESGGMFGIDSSYLDQTDVYQIQSVFDNGLVRLLD
jgi:hypothetical protein